MYILISYDVATGRTERYRKILSRYLVHEQNSVFAGDITESKHLRLRKELAAVAVEADKVLEVRAENRRNVSISLVCKDGGNALFRAVAHDHHTDDAIII